MKNKIISSILTFAIFVSGAAAYAGDNDFSTDFSGSIASKAPAGFDEWKSGGSLGSVPKLDVPMGVFGVAEDNMSVQIYSPEGVGEIKNPYIKKNNLNFSSEHFSAGVKIASSDNNSYKYAVLGTVNTAGEVVEYPIAEMNPTGGAGALYVGGILAEEKYSFEKWYGIDLEFTSDKVLVYINGEYLHEIEAADIAEVAYIKCGLSDKNAKSVRADVYFDDVYLKEGGVDEDSLINISTETFTLNRGNHTISNIPDNMNVEGLIAAIEKTTGTKLSVIKSDGTDYDGSILKHGMKLKAVSPNGINTVTYFLNMADCHILGLSNGDVLREGNISLAVNYQQISDIRNISYYVNDNCVGNVSEEPYTITYTLTKSGGYEVYAVVESETDSITTPKINITYNPNKLPQIEIVGMADGSELAYSDDMTVQVSASDSDGEITSCTLLIDGQMLMPDNSESPYVFRLNPISAGEHRIQAYAEDNEGGSTATEEIQFKVKHATVYTLTEMDFNKGAAPDLKLYSGAGSFEKVRDDFGLSYALKSSDSVTAATAYVSGESYLSQNRIVFECDYMTNSENTKPELILKADSNFNVFAVNARAEVWYHLRFVFDLKKSKAELYINNTLINKADLKGSAFADLRFNYKNNDPTTTATMYIDNFKVYYELEYPYITDMQLLSGDRSNVMNSSGEAGTDLKEILLSFNTTLKESYAQKDKFKLYVNGIPDSTYDISFRNEDSGTDAILILRSAAKTNSLYEVVISADVSDTYNQSIGAQLRKSFKTEMANFDVADWFVYKNNKQLTTTGEIKKGDEIEISANVINNGGETEPSVLIFALYNGNQLIGYKMHKLDSASMQKETVISDDFTVTENSDGVRIEGYLWNAEGTSSKAAHFEMSK